MTPPEHTDQQILEVLSAGEWWGSSSSNIARLVDLGRARFPQVDTERLLKLAFLAWTAVACLEALIDPTPLQRDAMLMRADPALPPETRAVLQAIMQPWWDAGRDIPSMLLWIVRGIGKPGCPEHRQLTLLCCLITRTALSTPLRHAVDPRRWTTLRMIDLIEEWAWHGTGPYVPEMKWTSVAPRYALATLNVAQGLLLKDEAATVAAESILAMAEGGHPQALVDAVAQLRSLVLAAVPVVPMSVTTKEGTHHE